MELLVKIIAVVAAMVIGHPIMYWVTEVLRDIRNRDKKEADKKEEKMPGSRKITTILGYLERGIIVVIWFWGRYEFIGFWFAGKVIGNWDRREGEDQGAFSGYLIATTVSILLAIVVAISAEQVIKLLYT